MFKTIIFIMAFLIFSGCEDYMGNCIEEKFIKYWDEIYDLFHMDQRERIEDWQDRETECLNYPIHQDNEDFVVDIDLITNIRNSVVNHIESKSDRGNYWQTSCETEIRGKGDCEDVAIMIWKELRDAGFPDDMIGMVKVRWYTDGEKVFHVFAVVNLLGGDFYILDNGALYEDVQQASEVLNRSIELIVGFNLFSIWYDFPTFGRWAFTG